MDNTIDTTIVARDPFDEFWEQERGTEIPDFDDMNEPYDEI